DINRSDLNDNSKYAKKEKQVDHKAPIDVDERSVLDEISKTQDTTTPTNNRTGAYKFKNRKHVDHNTSIKSDSNNNKKNIESALNIDEIQDTTSSTNNRTKGHKPKKGKNLESSKKLDNDLQ
ncbi:35611_t:CDS:2, partial [Racocetra persica]